MENFYTAYTKQIDGATHYFVKRFIRFPEYKGVPDVLESYGMHTSFDKACKIAGINEPAIKQQLLDEIENNVQKAKVIDLKDINFADKRKAQ